MEATFLNIIEKHNLQQELEKGDTEAIKKVFNELGRLESLIRDYEIQIKHVVRVFESKTFKNPQNN